MAELLKAAYYDPSSEGCYGGQDRLKNAVFNATGVQVPASQVSEWLAGEEAYTLHKATRINYKRNRVIVYGIDRQFQADLVDMTMYSKENDNVKYLMTCIDVFSKYAWIRVLKTKTGAEVARVFEDILKEGRVPLKIQTDRGKEFFNKHFQKVMSEHTIQHFAKGSELKASVVERFNRTIKSRMWRYLTSVNSKRYVDTIQALVSSYNNSKHRSIKMRPRDVSRENESQVFKTLYGMKDASDPIVFKYKTGDIVRISKARAPFTKGYEQSFTHEFFTITECVARRPPVYRLKDYDGDIIDGSFYEPELQKIHIDVDKPFKMESILERKKEGSIHMVLVKWLGWPSKFNSWIPEKDVVNI